MGWTSYRAEHYKNGNVDRKAECDAYWEEGLNRGHYKVLKSCMKGSTYYAAIKQMVKRVENDIYEPIDDGIVFGVVFLTSVDNKSYWENFAYKDMDETCGPYKYDCPKAIIDLLSPTDNEYALEWRRKCLENANKPKLSDLPIGTKIKFTDWQGKERRVYKHRPGYQFKRPFWMFEGDYGYCKANQIPDKWEIVEEE